MDGEPIWSPANIKAKACWRPLKEQNVAGKNILFPRSDKAREGIPHGFAHLGEQVVSPVAYRNIVPAAFPPETLSALETGTVDCIAFTASSTVENLVAIEPKEYTLTALIEEIVRFFASSTPSNSQR